jgi:hypothetical protein
VNVFLQSCVHGRQDFPDVIDPPFCLFFVLIYFLLLILRFLCFLLLIFPLFAPTFVVLGIYIYIYTNNDRITIIYLNILTF